MLTYNLTGDLPLYEALYRHIRADILEGRLSPGEKLPSKRTLAEHLKISKITVETAYAQAPEQTSYIISCFSFLAEI